MNQHERVFYAFSRFDSFGRRGHNSRNNNIMRPNFNSKLLWLNLKEKCGVILYNSSLPAHPVVEKLFCLFRWSNVAKVRFSSFARSLWMVFVFLSFQLSHQVRRLGTYHLAWPHEPSLKQEEEEGKEGKKLTKWHRRTMG